MKKLFYLSMIMFMTVIASCSNNEDITIAKECERDIKTRAIITEKNDESVTNPNLITDWENTNEILLSSNKYVSAPWINGSPTELTSEFCKDIKKEDGWDMLFHTFKKLNFDEKQNYMCFYNKFTGVIKVFYYNETTSTGGTYTNWMIKQASYTEMPLRILDSPNFFSKADNEDSDNNSRMVTITNNLGKNVTGMTLGWNGFEYQIPRYSSESLDCDITIGAQDITITNYEFLGSNDMITTGTIKSVTSTDKTIAEGTTTQSGGEAIEYIKKIASQTTKLKDINLIGGKIGEQLKKITSSKPYDYISKGLKFLFGRSTATTHYTNSKVYLETNGKITLSGTGTSSSPTVLNPITFNLQGILKKRASTNSSNNISKSIVKSNTDFESLGVWTINKVPCVYYTPLGHVFPTQLTKYGNVSVKGSFTTPYFYYDIPEIIFNPAIKPYIKSYKTDLSFLIV